MFDIKHSVKCNYYFCRYLQEIFVLFYVKYTKQSSISKKNHEIDVYMFVGFLLMEFMICLKDLIKSLCEIILTAVLCNLEISHLIFLF